MTELLLRPLADAFLEVGVLVAVLVAVAAGLRLRYGDRLLEALRRHRHAGPAIAAVLGVLPGCGGAILVVPLYVRGHVTYGSLVAALTATMGDASFVLLAANPVVGLQMHAGLLALGLVTGYVVDGLRWAPRRSARFDPTGRQPDPERPGRAIVAVGLARSNESGELALSAVPSALWLLAAVGTLLAFPAAAQVLEPTAAPALAGADTWLLVGVSGAAVSFALVARAGFRLSDDDGPPRRMSDALLHGAHETAFVVVWVAVAMVAASLLGAATGLDSSALPTWGVVGVLVGALVGLVPGCGVQIAFTGLYVAGGLPLPVLAANAVSQDGDALLPLLALDRRAAVVTSVVTTVPAVLTGSLLLLS